LKTLKKIWDNFEKALVVFVFILILVVILVQILMRLIFNNPLMFTEELARFLYLWMIFLGLPAVTKAGSHLCLEIISQKIYARKKAYFIVIFEILSIAMFAFILYHSFNYIEFSMANPAPALRIPMGIVYWVVPISMILGIIRAIERIVIHIKRLAAGDPFDDLGKLASDVEVDLIGGGDAWQAAQAAKAAENQTAEEGE